MAVLPHAARVALDRDYFQKAKNESHINKCIGKVGVLLKTGPWPTACDGPAARSPVAQS